MQLRCDTHIAKCFASESTLAQSYGTEQAKIIVRRISELRAAKSLAELRSLSQVRLQELDGDGKGKLALKLDRENQLIIAADTETPQRSEDGSLDWKAITEVSILGVSKQTDTH